MRNQFIAVLAIAAVVALGGCASKTLEGKKIDYKSAGKGKALDVPADLSVPPSSDRYNVPEASSGTATYSEYTENQSTAKPGEPSGAAVLPQQQDQFHVERGGSQRWLVAKGDPDALWPAIREFWQDSGFLIDRESPELGVMETDWAENRAKIADSTIRKLLGKVLDQAYSYPERDKFRTRLERGTEPGTTEIYVSHRGAYQVVVGERQQEQVKWQMRPTDPELEAEMLYRLMARLSGKQEQAEAQRKQPVAEPRAELTTNGNTPEALLLRDSFDRAWRRVGLALDRVGFTVEDRDRSKGIYYVRYVDPDSVDEKSESFMSRLAFWRSSDAAKKQEQYRISVSDAEKGSQVRVLNAEGQKSSSPNAGRILSLLQAELK